jgi:sugar/nucleoside kinase (ribokinase family)
MTLASLPGLIRFAIVGQLNRDIILPITGPPQIDVLGGNLPYAAVGLKLWDETAGLVANVDKDFPSAWLERLRSIGMDVSGIQVSPDPIDMRRFMAHSDPKTTHFQNPVQHFADRKLPFPSVLLGYQANSTGISHPPTASIQISDIPEAYLDASAVHICPIDLQSQMTLPSLFRQGQATTITLCSHPGYMSPTSWEQIPGLLSEMTAFITSEAEIRNLFQGRRTDLWEMAEVLANFGTDFVLIRTNTQGVYLFDRNQGRRWIVPNYEANPVDPTGADDAFAGGFLAGYRKYYDPLEATIMGNIAASLVVEGSGAFYALEAMPGLPELRMEALKTLVQAL